MGFTALGMLTEEDHDDFENLVDFEDLVAPVVSSDLSDDEQVVEVDPRPVIGGPHPELLVRRAREAFAHFHRRAVASVGTKEVAASAAGLAGWAAAQKALD
jgi:hypothetical protein